MPQRPFSVPAYLLAVAGGCVFVGIFWVLYEAVVSASLNAGMLGRLPVAIVIGGYFPALLLCLPPTLLSLWIANRVGLHAGGWYAGFGGLTGWIISMPLLLALPRTSMAMGVFLPAVFTLAGVAAALIYFMVERMERKSPRGEDG